MHPILYVKKTKGEEIFENEKKDKTAAQSHIHIELNRAISPTEQKKLRENLERVLNDAYLANRDWEKMRNKILQEVVIFVAVFHYLIFTFDTCLTRYLL